MPQHLDVTTDTATTLQNYLNALVGGDLEQIGAFFAADATWQIHGTLPLSGTYRGRAEIIGFLSGALDGLFEPGSHSLSFGAVVANGETAVLEWGVTGIGARTRLPYDNAYCGVFVIRRGHIQAVREYVDTDHLRTVLYGAVDPS